MVLFFAGLLCVRCCLVFACTRLRGGRRPAAARAHDLLPPPLSSRARALAHQLPLLQKLGAAEVDDFQDALGPLGVKHDVLRLDVHVRDAPRVRVREEEAERAQDRGGLRLGQRAGGADVVEELAALALFLCVGGGGVWRDWVSGFMWFVFFSLPPSIHHHRHHHHHHPPFSRHH